MMHRSVASNGIQWSNEAELKFDLGWRRRDNQSPRERNGLEHNLVMSWTNWIDEQLTSRLDHHTNVGGSRKYDQIVNLVLLEPGQDVNANEMSPVRLESRATCDPGSK